MVEGSSFGPLMAPLGDALARRGMKVAVAESCTGGLLGATLTDLAGASRVFVGGFITYTHEAKERLLGIPRELLETAGAVSEETARRMAEAAAARLGADLALSVTGVAGPEEQEGKPVGLVYVGATLRGTTRVFEHRFGGGRASNRVAAVEAAIQAGLELLEADGQARE